MISRRLLLVGVALGLAGMLATGIPTFLFGGGREGRQATDESGPVYCPDTTAYYCIPKLRVDDVVAPLKARGYRCTNAHESWECKLQVGAVELRANFRHEAGGISGVSATIAFQFSLFGPAGETGERGLAFMQWVATVPYAHEPQSVEEIRAWVAKQVTEKRTVEATIGDYKYVMKASDRLRIDLEIKVDGPL